MAFRRVRRRVLRRKPVSRRRRYFRRRYIRRRRNRGNLLVKCTKVSELVIPNNATSTWSLSFVPTDFPEIVGLMKNFETGKFLKQRVRVMPLQNVANNSTSQVPGYCMFPWHVSASPPASKLFTDFMSIDRARYYSQTQKGYMSFVPSLQLINLVGSASESTEVGTIKYKPEVPWNFSHNRASGGGNPRINAGCLAFQGDASAEGREARFNIIQDVWVLMKNQCTLYL